MSRRSARGPKTSVTTNACVTLRSSDEPVDESALGAFEMGIGTTRHNNWSKMYQMPRRRLSHVVVNESEIAVSVQSHGQGEFAYAMLMGVRPLCLVRIESHSQRWQSGESLNQSGMTGKDRGPNHRVGDRVRDLPTSRFMDPPSVRTNEQRSGSIRPYSQDPK